MASHFWDASPASNSACTCPQHRTHAPKSHTTSHQALNHLPIFCWPCHEGQRGAKVPASLHTWLAIFGCLASLQISLKHWPPTPHACFKISYDLTPTLNHSLSIFFGHAMKARGVQRSLPASTHG